MRWLSLFACWVAVMGAPSLLAAADKWEDVPEQWIEATGVGKNKHGDCSMDTDGGDHVLVKADTELSTRAGNSVWVTISFTVTELTGDHTKIEGTYSHMVYEAPSKIDDDDIEAEGGRTRPFNGETVGENHAWNRFDRTQTNGTYWKELKFRVDGPKGVNDCD